MTEDEILEATEHVQRAMMGDREAAKRVVNLYAPRMLDYIRDLQRQLRRGLVVNPQTDIPQEPNTIDRWTV